MAPLGHRVNPQFDHSIRGVLSGSTTGPRAATLRALLGIAEPFYAAATILRNRLFDFGIRPIHRLPRPVISIGNITTGGTGKTPMVRWLAEHLRDAGRRVAILSRGYGAAGSELGDELSMLDCALNDGSAARVPLRANPDRLAAGRALLDEHPETDLFILDDGFQHRRVARDLDVVLISAAEPFGFGHVLPRGMLREPLSGLRRAGAIVVTHADQADPQNLREIEEQIRRHNSVAPLYRAVHAHTGLRGGMSPTDREPEYPMEELTCRRFFAFCGIADPRSFDRQLSRLASGCAGRRWYMDHHRYTREDLESLQREARAAGADTLVTTDKDWVKISQLIAPDFTLPVLRVEMRVRFEGEDDKRLLNQISLALRSTKTVARATSP